MGNSKEFRNPVRIALMDKATKFPGAEDERRHEYERIFGTQDKGFAAKGKPF